MKDTPAPDSIIGSDLTVMKDKSAPESTTNSKYTYSNNYQINLQIYIE